MNTLPPTTLCWACSYPYAIDRAFCPKCDAANANYDPQRALEEMEKQAEEARRRLTRARYLP